MSSVVQNCWHTVIIQRLGVGEVYRGGQQMYDCMGMKGMLALHDYLDAQNEASWTMRWCCACYDMNFEVTQGSFNYEA